MSPPFFTSRPTAFHGLRPVGHLRLLWGPLCRFWQSGRERID